MAPMMNDEERDKGIFWGLVARYNQVARELPTAEEVTDDLGARATARLVLAECNKIRAEIDAILARYRT
jgi:predicted alpha-1,6-mannanase (GH76 family)